MAGRPVSILDKNPVPKQLRRDQRRRISEIVKDQGNQPIAALLAVRDFVKKCSASEAVSLIRFTNREGTLLDDKARDPFAITLYTFGFDSESCETLGTAYHFRLVQEQSHEQPTLN